MVELTMRVAEWQVIDATIDNTGAIAAANGDDEIVRVSSRIREAGWAAARAHPRSADGWGGWPPVADDLTIDLAVPDWRFAIEQLHRWADVEGSNGPSYAEKLRMAGVIGGRLSDE